MPMNRFLILLGSSVLLAIDGASANEEITVEIGDGAEMAMVWIEPGSFSMGLPGTEGGDVELTRLHEVTISKGFYLGKYEVTQEQWEKVTGREPWLGADNVLLEAFSPAVNISWEEAQEFVHRLNQAEGDSTYRLPTEAEWEYACRSGSTAHWWFGDDETQLGHYAWYEDNTRDLGLSTAQPVGNLLPNRWGLYDMNGNALEWVQDWWGIYPSVSVVDPLGPETGEIRVLRGGGYDMDSRFTWSASRVGDSPSSRYPSTGMRLVRMKSQGTAVNGQSWGRAKQHAW